MRRFIIITVIALSATTASAWPWQPTPAQPAKPDTALAAQVAQLAAVVKEQQAVIYALLDAEVSQSTAAKSDTFTVLPKSSNPAFDAHLRKVLDTPLSPNIAPPIYPGGWQQLTCWERYLDFCAANKVTPSKDDFHSWYPCATGKGLGAR